MADTIGNVDYPTEGVHPCILSVSASGKTGFPASGRRYSATTCRTWSSPRTTSLRLIGMERDLPGLVVANHFPGPFDRDVIADHEQNPAIPLKRLVDLRTLFTAGPFQVWQRAAWCFTTTATAFCFNGTAFHRRGNVSGDEVVSVFRRSDADLLLREDPESVVNP
jgi:hypothetical protein